VYFSETNGVKKITGGVLSLVAGTGNKVSAGDGGKATSASFVAPYGLWLDAANSLYVTDSGAFTVRKIDLSSGMITLFAGASGANNGAKFLGGGGLAVNAQLPINPFAVGDTSGNIFISGDSVVLRVEAGTNIIKQIAGGFLFNVDFEAFFDCLYLRHRRHHQCDRQSWIWNNQRRDRCWHVCEVQRH
jgi:hypothetical protein